MNSIIKRQSDEPFFKAPRQFPARSGNGKGFPVGPRAKARSAGNRELNKLPGEITHRCELKIRGVCIGDRLLQWAHATKSRFIVTKADWQRAARSSCAACHQHIEALPHREMADIIDAAIWRRKIA